MLARFWGEEMTTIVFLLNHALTKPLNDKMPFEACYSRKATVGFFKTFRCVVSNKNKRAWLKKLDDQSAPMVFIGYSEGAKVYQMLEPGTRRVHVSCNVIFDESRGWEWDAVASNGDSAT
jgi:hypothetical protein